VRGDQAFLIPETIDFCEQHNQLFLDRPDWLRNATCISAFIFPAGYLFILWVALMDHWDRFYATVPLLLFIGAKMYAIYFYHLMEFTSDKPPQHLIPYFSAEGPYVVSMFIVAGQVMDALAKNRGRLEACEALLLKAAKERIAKEENKKNK
jgi:hypothetical protein